jgi:hypothetical protein
MDYIGARKKIAGHPNLMKCFRAGSILTTSTRPFFVVASEKKMGAIYDLVGHPNLMKYIGNRIVVFPCR